VGGGQDERRAATELYLGRVAAQTVGMRRGEEGTRRREATVRTDGRDRIRRLSLRRREGFAAKLAVGVCTRVCWVTRLQVNFFERVYRYSKPRPKVTRPVTSVKEFG
jgi:hypothetical protein